MTDDNHDYNGDGGSSYEDENSGVSGVVIEETVGMVIVETVMVTMMM